MRRALRSALVDFYHQSWRLFVLNTALSALALALLSLVAFAPAALLLVPLLGPPAAALAHCTVVLAQTGDLRLGEALTGLRLHWTRGLMLAAVGTAVVVAGVFALVTYAGAGAVGWPLAMVVFYLLALYGVLQLALWPLAVAEHDRPLRDVAREAAFALLRRPAAFVGLGLALLLVNLVGVAAAVLPFLTLTIAYTFLAAAHFALPRNPLREAPIDV